MMLGKQQILEAADLRSQTVDCPEWGGTVIVRGLTGAERDAFEASVGAETGQVNMADLRAKLCALAIRDENGDRVFSDADVPALGAKSGAVLDRVFTVAQKLSGLSNDDVEELTKK